MKNFSKDMMALCAETLKFLVPYTEKFPDPSYKIPDEALEKLQKMLQGIVKKYLDSPEEVKTKFRAIADEVESLRRLNDMIKQTCDGVVKTDLKAEILTVRKRLLSIKVNLNGNLGKAPKQLGCIVPVIVLVILSGAGWFFLGPILTIVQPFLGKQPAVQTEQDADLGDQDEGDEADVTSKPEEDSEAQDESEAADPSKAEAKSDVKQEAKQDAEPKAEQETPDVNSQSKNKASGKTKPDKKTAKKTNKKGEKRTWTDLNGTKQPGRFVRMDGQATIILEIKENGKWREKGFAIGNFCEKDQEYIRKNYME